MNGAVTLPVPVSRQLASGLQSGPLSSLLGAAGIRSANPPNLCNGACQCLLIDIAQQAVLLVSAQLHYDFEVCSQQSSLSHTAVQCTWSSYQHAVALGIAASHTQKHTRQHVVGFCLHIIVTSMSKNSVSQICAASSQMTQAKG